MNVFFFSSSFFFSRNCARLLLAASNRGSAHFFFVIRSDIVKMSNVAFVENGLDFFFVCYISGL